MPGRLAIAGGLTLGRLMLGREPPLPLGLLLAPSEGREAAGGELAPKAGRLLTLGNEGRFAPALAAGREKFGAGRELLAAARAAALGRPPPPVPMDGRPPPRCDQAVSTRTSDTLVEPASRIPMAIRFVRRIMFSPWGNQRGNGLGETMPCRLACVNFLAQAVGGR
jgi:hypothetical protein